MRIYLRHCHGRFYCWCLAVGRFDVPIWPYSGTRPLLFNSRREALRQILRNTNPDF